MGPNLPPSTLPGAPSGAGWVFQSQALLGACPGPLLVGSPPPGKGGLLWSAPANPSLQAWQCEDNAGQKYLCGWRKVNFSASLFFPGNRGHRQIQQNRSRDRVRRGPVGRQKEPGPHTHSSCLQPSGPVVAWAAGGGLHALRIMASCDARQTPPTQHPLSQTHHCAFEQNDSRGHLPRVTQPVRAPQNSTALL